MDMCIDWECGHSKRLRHHHTGGFVPYPGQRFKLCKFAGTARRNLR